jgi:hypothetical protein
MSNHRSKRSLPKPLLLIWILGLSVIAPVLGEGAAKTGVDVFMYKNGRPETPTTHFFTTDTIVVRVTFRGLSRGHYTFHADWYNAFGELQDSSRSEFTLDKPDNMTSESQLELIRASRLKRLFSSSESTGYSVKFYGKWRVKLYLNGKEMVYKDFEIR